MEFSDTNAEALKRRGYVLKNDESNTVLGSAEIAKHAFDAGCSAGGAKMNFCSSRFKDAIQLRLRLLRTAQQFARPFDEITEDGTIIFGRVKVPDAFLNEVIAFLQENELPEEAYSVDSEKNTIETASGIVEELAVIFDEDGIDFENVQLWIIEQYPFVGGFVVGSERIF
ncbi:MAG: hypothetical protein LBE57_07640 [Methanosarcinales archaeon]|nr:hypothetical protein [Methanosarcinales archaeon]